MLEAKYFKDYRHNYMILQCGQEAASRSYQYKILTSDKIKEILRCSVRHINGVTYYYYDISSRTTLKSLYQNAKMSYEQVKDLFWQLHGICDKLAGFFMEEAGLVLLPEHIYYDFSGQRYIGLYYPEYKAAGAEAYEPLMNFLLEHIDTEDRKLAENMYRIYEMAGETHFLIEDALQILEEGEEVDQEVTAKQEEVFNVIEDLPSAEPLQEEKPGSKRSPFYSIFAVLSALGIMGAAAVYNMYELVPEEEIALYGIMAVSGVCLLISLWGIFRQGRKERTAESKEKAKMTADSGYEEFCAGAFGDRSDEVLDGRSCHRADEVMEEISDRVVNDTAGRTSGKIPGRTDEGSNRISDRKAGKTSRWESDKGADEDKISLGNVISRDMNLETMIPQAVSAHTASPRRISPVSDQETDYYGNTVFFDESKVAEYKLYAVDRRNKRHIELKRFPCTVGKMAGCVDYVLADNSVSRIHAKFEKQGDKVLLTDMNSTNGTYKNGLRMQPQETVEIEPGDEIRFGNLNYCYR